MLGTEHATRRVTFDSQLFDNPEGVDLICYERMTCSLLKELRQLFFFFDSACMEIIGHCNSLAWLPR